MHTHRPSARRLTAPVNEHCYAIFASKVENMAALVDAAGSKRPTWTTGQTARQYRKFKMHLEYEIECYARMGIRIRDAPATTSLPPGAPESLRAVYREIFIVAIRQDLGAVYTEEGVFSEFIGEKFEEEALLRTTVSDLEDEIRASESVLSCSGEKEHKMRTEADSKLLSALGPAISLRIQADKIESAARLEHAQAIKDAEATREEPSAIQEREALKLRVLDLKIARDKVKGLRQTRRLCDTAKATPDRPQKKPRSADSLDDQ